ncbi:hypothetical protein HRR90_002086 [Exophiala dermatitidis]|nr:hypothetical protein HRR73_002415 [Exophiala dermatitidis]KAJ4537007.1 hypothetical protein HRR76_005027 [Exophiala dermatitidis]KAJ4556437.1 hypothetical protein HRR78_002098 [Exophiala dermatitidis]KAJ4572291.1 hypothetical protein HRR79_003492 [Exophiala dermatitidis]KAJ4604492.1 hypothetical protein HRR84_001573 [Exophiala dermatitidis]
MAVKSAPVGNPVEKGVRKRKAKGSTAETTALEANLHDPSRRLGLFLEDNVISVELAGVEYPGLDAPIAQKRQFSAAWKSVAEELEKVLGLRRRTAADPLRSIPGILNGTRLDPEIVQTSTVNVESSEESRDGSTSELEAPVRKRARLDDDRLHTRRTTPSCTRYHLIQLLPGSWEGKPNRLYIPTVEFALPPCAINRLTFSTRWTTRRSCLVCS